jgi:hypothetical protein
MNFTKLILIVSVFVQVTCNHPQEETQKQTKKDTIASSKDSLKSNQSNKASSNDQHSTYENDYLIQEHPNIPQERKDSIIADINDNLASGEDSAIRPNPGPKLSVGITNYSSKNREMYLVSYASGAGAMDNHLYAKKDGLFYRIADLAYSTQLLKDSANGVPKLILHGKYPGADNHHEKYKLAFNSHGFDTTMINDIPYEEYVKAAKPSFQFNTRMDTFGMHFRILGPRMIKDSFSLSYPISVDQLFSLFMKQADTSEYRFAGYFPSFPRGLNKVYSSHLDRSVINGQFYPVFKTKTIVSTNLAANRQSRLHFFNGERYIGKLQPLASYQFYSDLNNDYEIEMNDTFCFEVVKPKAEN